MSVRLIHADCREAMRDMADASVDSVCTDPPYELGFMGKDWDRSGVANDVGMWKEVLRILKPGGWLIAFSHARTYHRMVCAIEDAGFEIRDQIMWIYGSGFPKGGNRDGKGTCLKPAHEPIVLARKPFSGSVVANEARFGTGALNIDDCRVSHDEVLREGAGGIPMRHDPAVPRGRVGEASAQRRYSDRGATDFAATPGPRGGDSKGRWPANIVHDGSEEVVVGFPHSVSTPPGNIKPSPSTLHSYGSYANRSLVGHTDSGSTARFFYCPKASKADRDEGLDEFALQDIVSFQTGNGESGRPSKWSEDRETQRRNIHETVKPTELMRWLVRLITPPGGLVFDPFTGSGSTGKAAVLEGRDFLGCEMTDAYIPIARARIAYAEKLAHEASAQGSLFDAA